MPKINTHQTATGEALYPWINKPDTKYSDTGTFKLSLRLQTSLATTQNLIALIDEQCEAFLKDGIKGLSGAELKKWSTYKPYEEELDRDTGEPTGNTLFHFKKNAKITLQDGEVIEKRIYIYDSKGAAVSDGEEPAIFGGTKLKALFSFRQVKLQTQRQIGAKLDLIAVQVIELAKRKSSYGFANSDEDVVEGGFIAGAKGSTNTPAEDTDEGNDAPY